MARTKDPKLQAQRRALVLDATIALLEEGSWKGTSLAAVAKSAQVSKGMVTYWFPDKDALLFAAIERYHNKIANRLAHILAQGGTVEERLDAMLLAAFPSVEQVRSEIAFQVEILSYAKSRPKVEEAVITSYQTFWQVTQAVITLGIEEGYITHPTQGLTTFTHALIDGLSFQVAADPDCDITQIRTQLKTHLERWFVQRQPD